MAHDAHSIVVLGAAQIDANGEQWIEVIPTANEARNGRWFFTITGPDLETYAKSIEAQAGLIPIDYDHAENTGTVAAGWFTGETLIIEAGGSNPAGETQDHESLWAKAKWTPQAVQEITDGRFKRLSPEFTFSARDTKTGLLTKAKEIIASTLTNRPFFRQMAPVGASGDVIWDTSAGFQGIRDSLSAALNPGPDNWRYCVIDIDVHSERALVEDTQARVTYVVPYTFSGEDEAAPGATDEWAEAKQEWVSAAHDADDRHTNGGKAAATEGAEMPDYKALASELGLPEDATDEQVLAAVKAAKAASIDDSNVVKLTNTQHAELEAKAALGAQASQDLAVMKVSTMFDQAEREGRMVPAERETLTTLCKTGDVLDADRIEGVKAALDSRPKSAIRVEAGSGGDSKNGATDASLTAAASEFESDQADGVEDDSVKTHLRALEILKEAGKDETDPIAYAAAAIKADKELRIAA